MRVLVIDDSRDLREVVAELLRLEGFDVTEAGSAAVALRLASAAFLDAALVDYNLPDARGDEVAARLRELHPALRIVAMTGDGARDLGPQFDAVLRKPFEPHELAEILRATGPAHRAA